MASQAELRAQLAATDNALRTLRQQLANAQPGSVAQTQLSIAVFDLEQQRKNINTALQNLTRANNPPNPQISTPTPVPPPPPLTTSTAAQGNPPDPTISDDSVTAQSVEPNLVNTTVPGAVSGPTASDIPLASLRTAPDNNFIFDPTNGELVPFDSNLAEEILLDEERQNRIRAVRAQDIGGNFTEVYNVETGRFDVVNIDNGDIVDTGLTQQEAILRAQERSVGDPGYGLQPDDLDFAEPIPTQAELRSADFQARSVNAQAMLKAARDQATLSAQRKAAGTAVGDGDWRVRLRLAPGATYLYKTPGNGTAGIMEPLRNTDGVIFPYTPRIDIQYSAEYSPYDLTHNNYRGYFYKGSRVGEVILTADFTAQDTTEANYMLAVIHFFKSCTKMFYGQDAERGSPPPLVYVTGLGEYQFNEHACVISNFNYSLPPDVDYIRARSTLASSAGVTQGGTGLMWQRSLAPSATASYNLSSIWARLTGANVPVGAVNYPPAPPNLGKNSPTYVPTKMQMMLTLLPIQSRQQVSQQFSLKAYANGNLLKGGFW
jgi:hypothetical protein